LKDSRSSETFLHSEITKEVIEQIAGVDSLVIFAGAGVSIDRTGLNWRRLLKELLDESGLDQALVQDLLRSSEPLSELQLASVVRSIYVGKGGDWRVFLSAALRKSLYTKFTWRGGRYTDAVARLARNLTIAGKEVAVVTTNYEQFIENAFQDATLTTKTDLVRAATYALERPSESAPDSGAEDHRSNPVEVSLDDAQVAVIHVHGTVADGAPRDGKTGSVVLGEIDYFESETVVADLLVDFFAHSSVLVLGSGLDDPPLLRALSESKKRAQRNLSR
jgi:hypothetical protein